MESSNPVIVRYNDKKIHILNAVIDVICESGVKDATISDIAKKAGVVDSVIYHYFKNKEDLLFSALDILITRSLNELEFHFQGIMDPVSRLGKMVWYHIFMNKSDRNTQARKSMLLEARGKSSFLHHDAYDALKRYIHVLDNILEEGIQSGFFEADLNVPLVRTMIFGFLDEEVLQKLGSRDVFEDLPQFEEMIDLVFAMIENRNTEAASDLKVDKHLAILQAAKKLFAKKGFADTTISEIAAQAGVAEGTIYEYFKNKQDLLLAITREYFRQHKEKLDNAFELNSSFDKLRHIMWCHIRIFAADKDLVTVFLKETKLSKSFYKTDASEVFVNYHEKIIEILKQGKASGEFRSSISSDVFGRLVMGSVSNLYNRWYYRDPMSPLDYTHEIHQFIEMLCRTVAVSAHSPLRKDYKLLYRSKLPGL